MLILLVDDERMVRIKVKSMLEQLYPNKHSFLEANNGVEAINLVLKNKPDLVFIDYKIPIKNGIEVVREAGELCKNTKWVLLSGYDISAYRAELDGLEIADFLLKPASLNDIQKAVQ